LTKGVRSEEKLVSSLSAGQDLSRFRATLGTPDRKRPAGEVLVYQFQRSRATLQAVVNRVGEVVSYAVYAKTTDFRPRFEHGLRVTLNTTTMDDAFEGTSLGANLYCGAHKAGYFEYFGGFNAVEARYFVLGVSDANTTEVSTGAICKAVTGDLAACNFSSRMLACVKSAGVGRRLRSTLRANVYIETAPGAPSSRRCSTHPMRRRTWESELLGPRPTGSARRPTTPRPSRPPRGLASGRYSRSLAASRAVPRSRPHSKRTILPSRRVQLWASFWTISISVPRARA
jgi:hypothetical protein